MTQILDAPLMHVRAEGLPRTLVDVPGPDRRRRARRFAVLGGVTLVWTVVFARHGGYSWHYFVQGSTLLFHGASGSAAAGGLDLYANYPELQIGPFTFAVAEVLRHLGGANGLVAAWVFMALLGLFVLYVLERIVEAVRPDLVGDDRVHMTMLVGGSVFMIGWIDLSVAISHLDDVLALTLAVLALWAAIEDLPAIAGICIGLSADSKPWALVFLPLILTVPAHTRRHAAVWTAVTIVAAYLPFVIADPHTLSSASAFTITNEPSSALRALGVSDPGTPSWDRIAQISLGCALGAVAVRRRRWPALILLGVGARIALDPGVYGYYTAGVLLGALLWDLLGNHRPLPIWTLISGTALAVAPILTPDAPLLGEVRLGLVVTFTVALLLGPAQAPAGFTARERTSPGPFAALVSPGRSAGH
jgi:hypothetical protein